MRRIVLSVLLMAFVPASCSAPLRAQSRREFWAFTGPWDTASNISLRNFGDRLDVVVTGWIPLDSVTAKPILPGLFPDTIRPRSTTTKRLALVTSWHGAGFHPRTIRTLASDPALLARTAGSIATQAVASGYRGLVLDFEDMNRSDVNALVRVVGAIADSARRRALSPIVLAIPATDTAAYPARRLLTVADLLLVMLYDQHWSGSEPGPISEPNWVRNSLSLRIAEAGPAKLIAGLPTYGYRWKRGTPGEAVTYPAAERFALDARSKLERDQVSQTLRATTSQWDMWVTDAALLRTLVAQIEGTGVRRFALWRLGQEDPALWSTLIH